MTYEGRARYYTERKADERKWRNMCAFAFIATFLIFAVYAAMAAIVVAIAIEIWRAL